jgi:hypothetical protein
MYEALHCTSTLGYFTLCTETNTLLEYKFISSHLTQLYQYQTPFIVEGLKMEWNGVLCNVGVKGTLVDCFRIIFRHFNGDIEVSFGTPRRGQLLAQLKC